MTRTPGPPPVRQPGQPPVTTDKAMVVYQEVQDTFRTDQSIQRALLGMFANDKALRDRFLAVTFSLLAKNSKLLKEASPLSIVQSIRDAAAWGLEPLTDECAIVAYSGVAQAQPMWRGYLKRIRNSGKVSNVDCQLVYENDLFEPELGTNPGIRHIPARIEKRWVEDNPETHAGHEEVVKDRGSYYGAYAWALFPDGSRLVEIMSMAEIIEVRDQFSRAWKSGFDNPWQTSFGEMARKTVLRRLAKRLPGAAVDVLLAADAALDEKQRQVEVSVQKLSEQTADLRQLAMQATGLIGPGDPEAAPETGVAPEPGQEAEETPAVEVLPPQRGSEEPVAEAKPVTDPNVQAAMDLAHEQERARRVSGR